MPRKEQSEGKRGNSTRDALLDAALRVAVVHGVRGITHRKVATEAGISLGSTNYHFSSIDDLVLEAFRRFSLQERYRYDEMFRSARTTQDVIDAVLASVDGQHENVDRAILLYELYAQGVRDPRYRAIVRDWSRATIARVSSVYSVDVAAQVEVVVEGMTFQRLLGDVSLSDTQARAMLASILGDKDMTPLDHPADIDS